MIVLLCGVRGAHGPKFPLDIHLTDDGRRKLQVGGPRAASVSHRVNDIEIRPAGRLIETPESGGMTRHLLCLLRIKTQCAICL